MKDKERVEEYCAEHGLEGATVFAEGEFVDAIVGYTTDGRVVYDYDKMVEWYCKKNNCSTEDAEEWIQYNTIRSLPYYDNSPIVINTQNIEEDE